MPDDHRPNKKIVKRKTKPMAEPAKAKDCAIKEICGACKYINDEYQPSLNDKFNAGLRLLEEHEVLESTHVIPPPPSERALGYRTHAKLAVRARDKAAYAPDEYRFTIGLFKPETHQVVDISTCPLHKPNINALIADLKIELESSEISPYDEESNSGDLRYLAIRSSHITDELMLTFVATNDLHKIELRNIIGRLKSKGHQIQSAYLNINDKVTNVIFGDSSRRITGSDRLRESLCNISFEVGPTSFFQVNPWEAERIYRRIEQLTGYDGQQEVAWDLYCGVGQISMVLSRAGYRVLGVEMNPQSIRDAQKNANRNLKGNLPHFVTGKVEDVKDFLPTWSQEPSLIITNPARKGLDASVRSFIKSTLGKNPRCELLYVSCAVETLARDLKDITSSHIKLRQLEAFDMFPYTDKMEWLAIVK